MSDTTERALERDAQAGDCEAAARLNAERRRRGAGPAGWLEALVGQWIYYEGVKINYRGILTGLLVDGSGKVEGLLMNPCIRTGEWDNQPLAQYDEIMNGERFITYAGMLDVGLMHAHWKKDVKP